MLYRGKTVIFIYILQFYYTGNIGKWFDDIFVNALIMLYPTCITFTILEFPFHIFQYEYNYPFKFYVLYMKVGWLGFILKDRGSKYL